MDKDSDIMTGSKGAYDKLYGELKELSNIGGAVLKKAGG